MLKWMISLIVILVLFLLALAFLSSFEYFDDSCVQSRGGLVCLSEGFEFMVVRDSAVLCSLNNSSESFFVDFPPSSLNKCQISFSTKAGDIFLEEWVRFLEEVGFG